MIYTSGGYLKVLEKKNRDLKEETPEVFDRLEYDPSSE